jgi:hypothetical protein
MLHGSVPVVSDRGSLLAVVVTSFYVRPMIPSSCGAVIGVNAPPRGEFREIASRTVPARCPAPAAV